MLFQIQISRVKILCVLYLHYNVHSYLNDMEIPGTKLFIPKGFKLGPTVTLRSLLGLFHFSLLKKSSCRLHDVPGH